MANRLVDVLKAVWASRTATPEADVAAVLGTVPWTFATGTTVPIAPTPAEIAKGVPTPNLTFLPGNVYRYGAVGDGSADDTQAFKYAISVGSPAYVPYGTYKITSTLTIDEGGLIGEGWGTAVSAKKAKLVFYNLTGATSAAIVTRAATFTGGTARLENLYILASSWDPVTGCSGYGLDIETIVGIKNVFVAGFKVNNLFLHNNVTGATGPYYSVIEGFSSQYSGQHGIVVGTGANSITFINPQSKWSGAPSYLTAPSVAGNYDGFYIDFGNNGTASQAPGNPGGAYFSYVPDGVIVIGGDCSFNSRYGWNFSTCFRCNFQPSYAEGNLAAAPGQVNLGLNFQNSIALLGQINSGAAGVNFGAALSSSVEGNTVFVGGLYCGSGDSNTHRANFVNGNKTNYFGYTATLANLTYINADSATGVSNISALGTGKWNLNGVPLYRDGLQVLGSRITGWTAATNTASRATFDTTTVTTAQLAARVKALIDDLTAHGLIGT